MQPALLIRLRPLGPFRSGPGHLAAQGSGAGLSVDTLFRSDRLFSALTLAFADLGMLDEWLDATARAEQPAVRVGSLFPFQGDTLFAAPPKTIWPPPSSLVNSPSPLFLSRLRWARARFVPVSLIQSLVSGRPALADQWIVDAESGCLLRRDRPSSSPFRHVLRRRVAVDRATGASGEADTLACTEFEASSGLWTAITFADEAAAETWRERVEGAFRLLADSGLGGARRIGFGQMAAPEFERGEWPKLLLPRLSSEGSQNYWLLSLYSPASADKVDWSTGDYRLSTRGGVAADGTSKKNARLVDEGSVISAVTEPVGRALDVAPDGAAHAIYRSGFALTVRLPEVSEAAPPETVEPAIVEEPAPAEVSTPAGSDIAEEDSINEANADEASAEKANADEMSAD